MATDQSTGGRTQADDFDACCDSGYYRRHLATYTASGAGNTGSGTTTYETVRPAYAFGHRAATNPTYSGRTFEDVEPELRRDYGEESTFDSVRDYVRQGFEWKTVLGALAVAAGGWWAGKKVYEAVSEMREEDEQDCLVFFQSHPARSTGLPFERARSGYALGYAAGRNPDYAGRSYEDVEPQLRSGFTGQYANQYDQLRDFTRRGYERSSGRSTGAGGTATV